MMKKLLGGLATLLLAMGLTTATAFGSQTADIDGVYRVGENDQGVLVSDNYFSTNPSWEDRWPSDFVITINNGSLTYSFTSSGTLQQETLSYNWKDQDRVSFTLNSMGKTGEMSFNVNGNLIFNGALNYYDQSANQHYWLELRGLSKEEGKIPDPQTLTTSFGIPVTTESGQYQMYISGFITADLIYGENILTDQQIKNQQISVHVKNNTTNEYRVMTASTIEGMKIWVGEDGWARISLNGRVQTSQGTLERYEAGTADLTFQWIN